MNQRSLFFAGLALGLAGAAAAQQTSTAAARGVHPTAEMNDRRHAPEEAGAEKDPAFLEKLDELKKKVRAKKGPGSAAEACSFRNRAVRAMAESSELPPCRPPLPLAGDENFGVRQLIYARPRIAARIFTDELEIARSTDAYSYRSQARSLYGDLAGAEADLYEAIKMSPQPELLLQRGHLHLRQRRHDRAIADFTRAMELGGCPPTVYHSRAAAYFSGDDYAAAAGDLERFFELNTDPAFADSVARSRLCRGLHKRGFAVKGCARPGGDGRKE